MEFMITCPVDGPIEVSLEDVETVVLREPEQAEVIFRCPECGTEVSVFVRIPSFLLAAIEAMAEDGGGQMAPLAGIVALSSDSLDTDEIVAELEGTDDDRIDAYCEYFRRQLAGVDSVEDALSELGCNEE